MGDSRHCTVRNHCEGLLCFCNDVTASSWKSVSMSVTKPAVLLMTHTSCGGNAVYEPIHYESRVTTFTNDHHGDD